MRATQKNLVALFPLVCFLGSFLGVAQPVPALAQTFNQQINYQGKLTASSSVAVPDGDYDMVFSLYTVDTGGSNIWTESRTVANQVTVTGGLFSVMLGEVSTLSGVDFSQTLYLGVNTEADGEMVPRKILGAVPAAFEVGNATTFNNLATTSFLRSDVDDTDTDTATGLLTFSSGFSSSGSSTIAELTTTVEQEQFTLEMRVPELSQVFIVQQKNEYSFLSRDIILSPTNSFVVQIPVAAVAGNLKSIIGTLLDPTNNKASYSFLLRINEDKTRYEAVIPALSVVGDSVLEVVIYDYEALTAATYKTPIMFTQTVDSPEPVPFPDVFFQGHTPILLGGTLLGAVLLTSLLVSRHRREDKVDEDSADY